MRSLRFSLAAGFVTLLLAAMAPPASACSCVSLGPPCQAYPASHAVFSGTPLGVSRVEIERDGDRVVQRLFRFRVEEAFRGVEGAEVEVLTGAWGGDCGYDFEAGTKYLVYGDKVQGKPWVYTGICTRTRPLSEAQEDLAFIRGFTGAPPGGEIFGSAHRYSVNLETGEWEEAGAIHGAKVTATSGGRRAEVVTGADGRYRLGGLAPGRYTVRVDLPPNLSPQEEQTVEVHDRGCAQVDYRAALDGRVSGRLLDARGQSHGIVSVDLVPLANGKQLRALWEVTEPDGTFEFKDLPPGRYLLGVNVGDAPDEDQPYKTTYYPSTHERSAAEVLTLGEGQHLAGIEFRLPPPLTRRAIAGVVVWPDGRPVARGRVSMTEVASGRPVGMDVSVDGKGRFSIRAFEGVRYKVSASVPADPNWNPASGRGVALLVSPEVEVTPSAGSGRLRLVIDTAGDGVRRTQHVLRAPRASPQPERRKRP